jgi:hypothetical protein
VINSDKPHLWERDIQVSVKQYNDWFLQAGPEAYRDTRRDTVGEVEAAFEQTSGMTRINPSVLWNNPAIVRTLRMSTAPPLARDRLIGLAYSKAGVVKAFEEGRIPRIPNLEGHVERICAVVTDLLDPGLFEWVKSGSQPGNHQWELAKEIVGDRLCGSLADPIIRNAQEQRQLELIGKWLNGRGYEKRAYPSRSSLTEMPAGTYAFHQTVVVGGTNQPVNMPIDVVIQPWNLRPHFLPQLIEAKSAGDFTNPNKRRKEEATKIRQLKATHGADCTMLLFLCGYFDVGYLRYEAEEGLDWVWEHRIDDLEKAGL